MALKKCGLGVAKYSVSLRRRLPRIALNLFLLGHLTILTLNNLPWSPFIEKLFSKYNWYVSLTGQTQDWGMYSKLDHEVTLFRLGLSYSGTPDVLPWGEASAMSPRRLYLVEGLCTRSGADQVAQRFFDYLRRQEPVGRKPNRAYLQQETVPIPGRAPAEVPELPDLKILEKRW